MKNKFKTFMGLYLFAGSLVFAQGSLPKPICDLGVASLDVYCLNADHSICEIQNKIQIEKTFKSLCPRKKRGKKDKVDFKRIRDLEYGDICYAYPNYEGSLKMKDGTFLHATPRNNPSWSDAIGKIKSDAIFMYLDERKFIDKKEHLKVKVLLNYKDVDYDSGYAQAGSIGWMSGHEVIGCHTRDQYDPETN